MLKKEKFFFAFRILVTLAILFALFKLIPYKKIIEVFKDSDKVYLFFAGIVFTSCFFLAAGRWQFLLRALEIKVTFWEAFCASFAGLFFNLFFPSFVAGDVFRSLSISHCHGAKKKVASSVLMDRYSGTIGLVLIALISYFFSRNLLPDPKVFTAIAVISLGSIVVSLCIFNRAFFLFLTRILRKNPKVEEKIISFHDQLYFFKKNPKVFLKSLLFSLPIQVLVPLSFFLTALAFGISISVIYFLILVPIIMTIALIPVTIAGAGTREASAVYFFALIGINKSVGLGISLFNLILSILLGILGGIFYVSVYHRWLQSHAQNSRA